MEILRRGHLPGEKEYTPVCHHCFTQVKFRQSEGVISRDQRDGDYVTVQCPVCDRPINCAL